MTPRWTIARGQGEMIALRWATRLVFLSVGVWLGGLAFWAYWLRVEYQDMCYIETTIAIQRFPQFVTDTGATSEFAVVQDVTIERVPWYVNGAEITKAHRWVGCP